MDINSDTSTEKYLKWMREKLREGWMIYYSEEWTRKGVGGQKHSSIDIIITQRIPKNAISIELLEYDVNLSDHKPIKVQLKTEEFINYNKIPR